MLSQSLLLLSPDVTTQMDLQLTAGQTFLTTILALVYLARPVRRLLVALEAGQGVAGKVTLRTDKHFVLHPRQRIARCAVYRLLVGSQVALVLKTFSAMGADERSIARVVRGLVIFQRVRSSKSLFTQITAERPFICMDLHVVSQCCSVTEMFST